MIEGIEDAEFWEAKNSFQMQWKFSGKMYKL